MPLRSISKSRLPRSLRPLAGGRPPRGSVITSALSLALAPSLAGALALGDLRTRSALGEPFAGRIELLGIAPDELDTVKILLASQAEFEKAGTARLHFLTGLEFQPRTAPEGRAIIRVTSRQPVREPFLDFLIQVDWPQGRLIKAYTVLLDPPAPSNPRPPKGEQPPARPAARMPPLEVATPESAPDTDERTEALHGRIRELETQLADTRRLLARLAALQRTQPGQFDGTTDGRPPEIETAQESRGTTNRGITATPSTETTPAPTRPHPEAGTRTRTRTADGERTPVSGRSSPWPAPAWVLTLALPLLLLGWLLRRRRKRREEISFPTEPVLGISSTAAAGLAAKAGPAEQTAVGPTTAPTTPTLAPANGFGDPDKEREETDSVSEADVYIAYGRYREAETLLEKTLAKSPQRPDIKYKLIEACYGTRNQRRMEALMDQLRKTGDDRIDPDQWQRCNAMLAELKGTDTQGPRPTAAADGEEPPATAGTDRGSPEGPGTPVDDDMTIPWPKN